MNATGGGHERLYRGLLRLYPADYRQAYGDQMVQLFGDQLREDGGRAWLKAPVDVITTAAAEHLRRNRTVAHSMSLAPTPAVRLLGLLGVVGGAVLLAAFVIEIAPDLNVVRLALFNIGAIAVVTAVHMRQAHARRRLALAGAIPAILANAVYLGLVLRAVAQPGGINAGIYPLVNLFIFGGAAMWLSDLWFGVVTLRLGVLSRWAALALIAGSAFGFIGMGVFGLTVPGTLLNTVIMTGIAVHGLAWILLGLDVALRRRAPLRES